MSTKTLCDHCHAEITPGLTHLILISGAGNRPSNDADHIIFSDGTLDFCRFECLRQWTEDAVVAKAAAASAAQTPFDQSVT